MENWSFRRKPGDEAVCHSDQSLGTRLSAIPTQSLKIIESVNLTGLKVNSHQVVRPVATRGTVKLVNQCGRSFCMLT